MMIRLLMVVLAFVGSASAASASKGNHDQHAKGEIVLTAKITKIISYENGMSLILDREISKDENCVHLENAASFESAKIEKLEMAKNSGAPVVLKITDGHIVDVL